MLNFKTTLNFLFKSKILVEPSKFPIYFARECRPIHLGDIEKVEASL